MNQILLILIILFCSGFLLKAQHKIDRTTVNNYVFNIPNSLTTSSQDISNYIDTKLSSDEGRVKAAFAWITKNISFDTENMYSFNMDSIVERTLSTRKGVCLNYAIVFNDIVNRMGIESHIVEGYTKENRIVSRAPHAWCVVSIDSSWFVYDPTWGAGEVNEGTFKKKLNYDYFHMTAEKAIKTHMPFDPIWQLLDYPITNKEFIKGLKKRKINQLFFNYQDSIGVFKNKSDIDRLIGARRRIDKYGIDNYLIYIYSKDLAESIDLFIEDSMINKYNSAYKAYNQGIFQLNRFIDFRNNQFSPEKGDKYLIQMMDSVFNSFELANKHLDEIKNPNMNIREKMDNLYKAIQADMQNVNTQKSFLDKILSTSKNYRKSLFYERM
ncbi:transglutaminase domain-containing protein [Labilibaculum antarcticum]|nr:transglutaminase domain-containing protein [Labilibaculum antarcticum]